MILHSDTVLDENNLPVPGASVYVYDINGVDAVMTSDGTTALLNPLTTDEFGGYSYYANTGYYTEDVWYGGRRRWREHNIAIGSPGADLNLRTDLAANNGWTLVGGDAHSSLYPESSGAVAGGADTTAAINAAITAAAADGRWLDGRGRTYGVTGKISLPSNLRMRDITFKQLAPGASASVITLEADTKDSVRLYRVKVNRNGDGTNGGFSNSAGVNGCLDTAYGIHINNCTNGDFDLLEVWGNDTGTGIRIENCDGSNRVGDLYAHDMTGIQTAGDGTDEAVCGVRFQDCTDISFGVVRVINMQMTYAGVTDIWGTRGIATGGLQRCRFETPLIKNVGEGFDVSGGGGIDDQADCVIVGGVIDTTYSWGFKLAHGVRRWRLLDCKTNNTGDAGFVCSTGSNTAVLFQDRNVIENCDAINPGGPKAGYTTAPAGFEFHGSTEANIIGAIARNCKAIDNNSVHTMAYGFFTDQTPTATNLVEAENCESVGHVTAAFQGIHEPRIHLTLAADVSIPNTTETLVLWDSEVRDPSDLHSLVTTPGLITIKRSGDYIITAQASWTGNATGIRQIFIQNNGTDITGASAVTSGQANDHTMLRTWPTIRLNAGDTLGISVKQTSGAALVLKSANSLTNVVIQRIPA